MAAQVGGVVITLIHGTWARRAEWTMPGSALSKHLRTTVPELRELANFEWSGSVLQRQRVDAACDFLRWHEDVRRRHPVAQHFVIAHSHGGNVALEAAMRDEQLRAALGGIICLSTPFLQYSEHVEIRHGALLAVATFGLGALGFAYVAPFISFWLVLPLLAIVLAFVWRLGIFRTVDEGSSAIRSLDLGESSEHHRALWGERPTNLHLLIVRSPGDEASSALGALQLLGWASIRLIRFTSRMLGPVIEPIVTRPLLAVVSFILAGLGTLIVAMFLFATVGVDLPSEMYEAGPAWIRERLPRWERANLEQIQRLLDLLLHPFVVADGLPADRVGGFWAIWGLCAFLATVGVAWHLLSLFVFGIAVVLYLLRLPFGFVEPFDIFDYAITAEACPPGEWTIVQASLYRRTSDLSHSEPYSQPAVLERISEWIAKVRGRAQFSWKP